MKLFIPLLSTKKQKAWVGCHGLTARKHRKTKCVLLSLVEDLWLVERNWNAHHYNNKDPDSQIPFKFKLFTAYHFPSWYCFAVVEDVTV